MTTEYVHGLTQPGARVVVYQVDFNRTGSRRDPAVYAYRFHRWGWHHGRGADLRFAARSVPYAADSLTYRLRQVDLDGMAGRDVQLGLYDVLGRRVQTVASTAKPGRHEMQLDTSRLSPGIYFLRLIAGGEARTQKLTVVRYGQLQLGTDLRVQAGLRLGNRQSEDTG